jgi:hypothetical protein
VIVSSRWDNRGFTDINAQTATSAKRPAEYIEHEESQVRRHSSVNARAASMAVARYGDHISVGGQGDTVETKNEKDHREMV